MLLGSDAPAILTGVRCDLLALQSSLVRLAVQVQLPAFAACVISG